MQGQEGVFKGQKGHRPPSQDGLPLFQVVAVFPCPLNILLRDPVRATGSFYITVLMPPLYFYFLVFILTYSG